MRISSLTFFSQNREEPLNAQQTSIRATSASHIQTMSVREYRKNQTIHNAARASQIAQLYRFLREGADVNELEKRSGYSPLQIALEIMLINDSDETQVIVTALIKNGAKVNTVTSQRGQTALHIFVIAQKDDADVQYLRKKGGANGIKDHKGQTPFSLAIDHENLNLILALLTPPEKEVDLALETDINVKGKFGQTALHIAVSKQNLTAITTLLHFKAKLLKNSRDETPLDLAHKLTKSSDPAEADIGAAIVALLDPLPPYTETIENHLALNHQFA